MGQPFEASKLSVVLVIWRVSFRIDLVAVDRPDGAVGSAGVVRPEESGDGETRRLLIFHFSANHELATINDQKLLVLQPEMVTASKGWSKSCTW
jgi:hypothetical protein